MVWTCTQIDYLKKCDQPVQWWKYSLDLMLSTFTFTHKNTKLFDTLPMRFNTNPVIIEAIVVSITGDKSSLIGLLVH